MGKKKSTLKGLEEFTFKTFLRSMTIPKIKEIVNKYNESVDNKEKKLK